MGKEYSWLSADAIFTLPNHNRKNQVDTSLIIVIKVSVCSAKYG